MRAPKVFVDRVINYLKEKYA
ncbi:unnamed protein product, partial [Allacma fusca]